MILLAALACSATIHGKVESGEGVPVAGAVLHAEGVDEDCDAVTDDKGRFVTRCARGTWAFTLRHPTYATRAWSAVVDEGGDVDLGSVRMDPIPMEAGAFRHTETGFAPLARAQLLRKATDTSQTWCVDTKGDAAIRLAPREPVLVNGLTGWRLYALDADGCAIRMEKGQAEHWKLDARRVALPVFAGDEDRPALGDDRGWVDVAAIPPGDYAVVAWYDGFLVREDVATDAWRAGWIKVGE
jgi:hypothetical protein